MEVLGNTENDRQINHRTFDCYVITLTSKVQKLRNQCATNPLNIGMCMTFLRPCHTTVLGLSVPQKRISALYYKFSPRSIKESP